MHTVRHSWQRPSLFDFDNWLNEKAENHERLCAIGSRAKMKKETALSAKTLVITKASLKIRCVKNANPLVLHCF